MVGRQPPPGAGSNDKNPQPEQAKRRGREALGRSRGGLSTKIHLVADTRCRPVATLTTAGQRHDSLVFEAVLGKVCIGRLGPGRPRRRQDRVLADKAYSAKRIRAHLRSRGIKATIPQPADQIAHRLAKGRTGGRPPAFDPETYKQRNVVERAINKLRNTRAVATRSSYVKPEPENHAAAWSAAICMGVCAWRVSAL
ncbi:MAG TPA: IS5 family transposase [Pilimelia sp.]|nr:IS5 family transposase [Pilimelia sp.]